MLNLARYNEIAEISEKYPFLKEAVKQNGTKTILKIDDLLDDNLFDSYDIKSDICNIMGTKFTTVYDDDKDTYYSYNKYPYISNISSIKTEDKQLAIYMIKQNNLKGIFKYRCFYNLAESYYQTNDVISAVETQKKILINILQYVKSKNITEDICRQSDNITNFNYLGTFLSNYTYLIYRILYNNINVMSNVGWTSLFNSLTDDEFSLIDNYFKLLSVYYNENDAAFNYKEDNSYYIDSPAKIIKNSITEYLHKLFNIFDVYITWIYNNYSSSEISYLCKNKFSKLNNLFTLIDVKYERKLNILNDKLSEEEKADLLLQFKSAASIKQLCTKLLSESSLSYNKFSFIVDDCILNNSKIKDRKFPIDKRKVITEMIKFIFISNHGYSYSHDDVHSIDAFDMENENDIYDIINKYYKYFYNPYFIELIYNTSSMWSNRGIPSTQNTKLLLNKLFSSKNTKNNIEYFIKEYIEGIYNSTDLSIDKNVIKLTFGSLRMFIEKFINSEYAQEAIKKVLIDDYKTINIPDDQKYKLLLLYSIITYSNDIYIDECQRLVENENRERTSSSNLQYASPFRKYVLGELFHSITDCFNNWYSEYAEQMIYIQEHGFLNSLLTTDMSTPKSKEIERKLDDSCINLYHFARNSQLNDFSNNDITLKLNAKKFVLLKLLEKLQNDENINEDLFNSCLENLKMTFVNNNKVILTESCSGGANSVDDNGIMSVNVHCLNEKNEYSKVIDIDTLLLYNEFIKLNDKYKLFDINDSLEEIILIPLVDPLNRSYSYVYRYSNSSSNKKYGKNSTSIKVYNEINNISDEEKESIFNKFFKPYIDDEFLFNEAMSSTIFSYLDKAIEYIKANTYGASFKRYLYTKIDDLDESLVGGSASDTLLESYRYFISDLFGDKHSEEFENLFNKLEQMSINYNCMTSLLG